MSDLWRLYCTNVDPAPKGVFAKPYATTWFIRFLLFTLECKHIFKINPMHEYNDNVPQVPILAWLGMMSSLTLHGALKYITRHRVLLFDKGMVVLQKSLRHLKKAKFYHSNWPFIFIHVALRKTIHLKTTRWIFCHPYFLKTICNFMYLMLFVLAFVIWDPQNDH